MTAHLCEVCLKEFSSPYHLNRHRRRKKPCTAVLRVQDPTACPHCGKNFSTKGNMLAHVRNQTCVKAREGGAPPPGATHFTMHNGRDHNVVNITINHNGPLADPSKLRDFGQEDISHLTPQVLEGMLRSLPLYLCNEDAGTELLRRTLTSIWADDKCPENHNVVQLKPRGRPLIVEGGKWRESSEDAVHGVMQGRAAALIARAPARTPADQGVKRSVAEGIARDEYRTLTRATVSNAKTEFEQTYGRLPVPGERWVPLDRVEAPVARPLPSTAHIMWGGGAE